MRLCGGGKYIIRLDADDYFATNALEKMSGKLETNPELGMVFPNYYYVDENDRIIGEEIRHDFDNNEVSLLDQPAHGVYDDKNRFFKGNWWI